MGIKFQLTAPTELVQLLWIVKQTIQWGRGLCSEMISGLAKEATPKHHTSYFFSPGSSSVKLTGP
jgi:hypothetical protein